MSNTRRLLEPVSAHNISVYMYLFMLGWPVVGEGGIYEYINSCPFSLT